MNRSEAAQLGGIATRDGFAARFEREHGRNYYAAISPGGKRRPRRLEKEPASRLRGGREPRKPREVISTRFS